MRTRYAGCAAVALILLTGWASAQTARFQMITCGLTAPIYATHAPGGPDRLFVVQQGGIILLVTDCVTTPAVFLDITARVSSGGERGLLGLAFHPNYAQNGYFYVNYTANPTGAQLITRIARFQATGPPATAHAASAASELVLFEFDQPFNNHNAGMLAFSPLDGYLYVGTGDGGSGNDPGQRAQNLSDILGKMLRIDVDKKAGNINAGHYSIPDDNPFLDAEGEGSALPEIWASGLRNPFRYSFDREMGDLWIGDVGQNAQEEINLQPAASTGGENYGWRVFEGTRCNTAAVEQSECDALEPEVTFPIHTYVNPDEGRAVTGGVVYRGAALPNLTGRYFFADSQFGRLWSFLPLDGEVTDLVEHTDEWGAGVEGFNALVAFGEDTAGEMYVVSISGSVFKLVPRLTVQSADVNGNGVIGLSELLRVIQFYNLGSYHCQPGAEDDFAPGNGNRLCVAHATDYSPQDWSISLEELLRTIQIYNSAGYVPCPEGEDGFCIQTP